VCQNGTIVLYLFDCFVLGSDRSSTTLIPEFVMADGETIGAFPTDPNMIFKPGK
jgi:hypothetical protein